MSSAVRMSFCVLALSLLVSASAQFQSLASTPDLSQVTDEETLRTSTEQYARAIAANDLEAIRGFWNPQSPALASRMRIYQTLFLDARIEFVNLKITRLDITGDKAVLHQITDERLLDKVTGTGLTEWELFQGTGRSFEWTKTDSGWKIQRESSLQEELVAKLEEANSEAAQQELLEKNKTLVTNELVRALIERSTYHRFNEDFDKASNSLRFAQNLAEKIGDRAGLAKAWLYLGMIKAHQNDDEQALRFEQQALAIHEAAGNKTGEAITLFPLSHTLHELGDYQKAFEYAHKSLRLAEEIKHRGVNAHALTEIAHIYIYQNNSQQALVYLEKSLPIFQELGDKIQVSITRFSIITQQQELGNYAQALEIYKGILEQTERGKDPVGASIVRQAMGRIYFAMGKNAEAMDSFNKALQGTEAPSFVRSTGPALIGISKVLLAEKKYREALPLAERAVSLSLQIIDQRSLYDALTTVGYCHLGLNQPENARRAFSEAISTIEDLRRQTIGSVEDRLRHFEIMLGAYHGMLRLLVQQNQPLEALVFAEKVKARGLLEMLQQGKLGIQKAMTIEEQQQEHRLKTEMSRLNTQLIRARQTGRPGSAGINEIKSNLEKARLDYEAFQTTLYAAHPELKVKRGEAPVINAEELATLLPDAASALIEYVVADNETHLFVITKAIGNTKADVRIYTLPIKQNDLAKQTELFRQQLASRDLSFRASATKLYNLLLKPAQAQLQGKTNLIIAPDNVIWDLPFQALLTSTNRFLIEDTAISYAPSLTTLREMTKRRNNQSVNATSTTLLALGNPLIGKETVTRATMRLRDEKLAPLPEAEQEVKALKQLYGTSRSKVYTGADAREDRVKTEAGQAKILHFAAHGMLNNTSPMYSHLALAEGSANEDGLLEAWELMQMDLKADLAVLSACETARGRIGAGEGMIGLSWAMFVAGVPSIVVSQWKVESAGTRDLMVNFHRTLIAQPGTRQKPTKAAALRQAALKLMNNPETRHPFYWAGFVLVGGGN
jgi:CHAT domain-containing protein/tetratricopeptide (TPR) repeat protein